MLTLKGQVVSAVGVSLKGCGFKVMIQELGDTFRVFIPAEKLNGQEKLKILDLVDVVVNRFYPRKNEVGLEVISINKAVK